MLIFISRDRVFVSARLQVIKLNLCHSPLIYIFFWEVLMLIYLRRLRDYYKFNNEHYNQYNDCFFFLKKKHTLTKKNDLRWILNQFEMIKNLKRENDYYFCWSAILFRFWPCSAKLAV